jgi:regulatory protein
VPTITKISQPKRGVERRNIFLDGRFAFACSVNVVARFRLRAGTMLTDQQVGQIKSGELRQQCFDSGLRFLRARLHSRSELKRKLLRRGAWRASLIETVLDDLQRMGYLDDARFAKTRALAAAQHRKHGRQRARLGLLRAGVSGDVADRALADVYEGTDTLALARSLALKQASRLRRLDPAVARRRLIGMLQRRGFEYDDVRQVISEVLGSEVE